MFTHPRPLRLLLVGLGNVGRRFLELLLQKGERLRREVGVDPVLVGVADSSGAAIDLAGLSPGELVRLKGDSRGAAEYAGAGRAGVSALEMVASVPADLLLEAAPANLRDGQPGLACIEEALRRGMHVVTADKAPLVLAYAQLREMAAAAGVHLRFSATVGGGLPTVNLGRRDLALAEVTRLEGVLNLTTNYILTGMAAGLTFAEALERAQAAGHAEADATLDVEGWDAAGKLVILAHSVLGYPAALEEVERRGITHLGAADLARAAAAGRRIKPLAVAEREGAGYRLWVEPVELPAGHPLAALGGEQMAVVYHTDIYGQVLATIVEETPLPTAAAMLRDMVEIAGLILATGPAR